MRLSQVLIVLCLISLAIVPARAATPSKLGLRNYEKITPSDIKSLEEYENKKVSIDIIYNTVILDTELLTPDQKDYDLVPSLKYCDDWIKEAFPRDKFTIISTSIPVVAFKKCDMALKSIKNGDKVTISGTVKKKTLRYKIKRDMFYLDVESIQTGELTPAAK